MNNRIKKLRKALDLTQQEFSNRIGCSRNLVANYEIGNRNPSSSVINNICKTFNVNEEWLRTGEGEMFAQRSEADELAAAVERLITGESADFKRRLVSALSTLKDEHWLLLEQKLKEIVGTQDATPVVSKPTASVPVIAAELAELKRQNQELATKVAAMEEEDALLEPMDTSEVSPSVSDGTFSPSVKNNPGKA